MTHTGNLISRGGVYTVTAVQEVEQSSTSCRVSGLIPGSSCLMNEKLSLQTELWATATLVGALTTEKLVEVAVLK